MKTLNFKFTLAILCTIAIAFTSCSKEEIATNDTTDLVSGNEETTIIKDYWVEVDDLNNIDWAAIEAARIEGQEIDSRCPGCLALAAADPVLFSSSCTVKICATLGPSVTYTVEGGGIFFGPGQYCVTIPINEGDSRDVGYVGTGGISVQQYENNTNPIPCTLWSVAPSVNSVTAKETTLVLNCAVCG